MGGVDQPKERAAMSKIAHVKDLLAQIAGLYAKIDAIQEHCAHTWEPSNPENLDSSVPFCPSCGLRGTGWWCAASPTKTCVYSKSYDQCDFCGNPEERK